MRLLSYLVAFVFLTGCGFANKLRLVSANNDVEPEWTAKEDKVRLNSIFIGEQMFVDVNINGKPGFRFLLDTGASIPCLLTTPKVQALNLQPLYEVEIGGNGDEQDSPAFASELKMLQVGAASYSKITFCVIPIASTKYYLRDDEALFDGVIGVDFFDHFPVQVDAINNRITMYKNQYAPEENEQAIHFEKSWSKYYIETELSLVENTPVPVELIVDTGSRNYLKLNNELLKEFPADKSLISAADFGLSGRNEHKRGVIHSVSLGGIEVPQVRANFIHNDDDDDITYILGNALLNQFIVTYDAPAEKMWIRRTEHSEKSSLFNLVGLQLRKTQSGNFVVRNIIPELPAAQLDFQEGDLITSIDGRDAKEVSLKDWIVRSAQLQPVNLCRKRSLNSKCMDVSTEQWFK